MQPGPTTIVVVLFSVAACTAAPTAPAPATMPVAATLAPAPSTRVSDASYAGFVKSARSQGYRRSTTGGKELWCREGSSIDSRIAKQSCIAPPPVLTEAQGGAPDTRETPDNGE